MKKKDFTPEQIINVFSEAELRVFHKEKFERACRSVNITGHTCCKNQCS